MYLGVEYGETKTLLLEKMYVDSNESNTDDKVCEPSPKRVCHSVFADILTHDAPSRMVSSKQKAVEKELEQYLGEPKEADDADVHYYWSTKEKVFPNLFQLAKQYLTILASSAPVERLFSQAGRIITPERGKLSDENFLKLMNIRSNMHFIA